MATPSIQKLFKGQFLASPAVLKSKIHGIKAYIFDWDGVFNNGQKDIGGSSLFNEVDSMGTNLLRYNHYRQAGKLPVVAIVSGEKNAASFKFAEREHFNSAYYSIKHKTEALKHFCNEHKLKPAEVAFFFDDVLDFSIAKEVGLRIMIGRSSNPLLIEYAKRNKLADYVTANDGGNNGLREGMELILGLSGSFDETISNRITFSKNYQVYFTKRNAGKIAYFTYTDKGIVPARP